MTYSTNSIKSEQLFFNPHNVKESELHYSTLQHTRSFPVFGRSPTSPSPLKRYRRGSVDRPSTPARIRHSSGARRLSLYDNTEILALHDSANSSSSDETENGIKLGIDKKKKFLYSNSEPERRKSHFVDDLEKSVSMRDGTGSIPIRKVAAKVALPKSKSLESEFINADQVKAIKSEKNRKRSLEEANEKWPTVFNIASSTTTSGVTRRPKKDNAKEAESKRRNRKSLPSVFKIKRNSLPNVGLLKNMFSRSFGNSDITEPNKEKEKLDSYQRRQSLPEHKIREQVFPKLVFKVRKTSASNSPNSIARRKFSKDGPK